jgi:multidrug efflux pump subunit AcrB
VVKDIKEIKEGNNNSTISKNSKKAIRINDNKADGENSIEEILDIRKHVNEYYLSRQNEPRGGNNLDFAKSIEKQKNERHDKQKSPYRESKSQHKPKKSYDKNNKSISNFNN